MQFVFAVWFTNFDSLDELVGLYSSEKLAQAQINKFDKTDRRSMRIEKEALDDYEEEAK